MAKGNPPKEERNKELVLKRLRDPKRWTFRALGSFFNLSEASTHEIFHRDKEKYRKLLKNL